MGDVDKMVCGRIQYMTCKEYHCGSSESTFSLEVISTRSFMQLLRDFSYGRKNRVNVISAVRKYAAGTYCIKLHGIYV